MTTSVDIDSIQQKLYESLKPSGWAPVLQTFLLSSDFTDLLKKLYAELEASRRFTPLLKEVFTAFYECPVKDLHTILVLKEPYTEINSSSGIALDCSKTSKEHPWLGQVFDAIERTVYKREDYERDLNLTRWANQGILLLSANLTTQINAPGRHGSIWNPFTTFLLDTLNSNNCGLHFVFIGDDVKYLTPMINIKAHYKFFIQHPRTYGQNKGVWDSENIFPILSKSIQKNYNKTIVW